MTPGSENTECLVLQKTKLPVVNDPKYSVCYMCSDDQLGDDQLNSLSFGLLRDSESIESIVLRPEYEDYTVHKGRLYQLEMHRAR